MNSASILKARWLLLRPFSWARRQLTRRARRRELKRDERLRKHIEGSLESCGQGLIFDDVLTVTILAPHKLSVGANVGFNRYVFINAMGGIRIGDDSRFGPFVMIHSADHRFNDLSMPTRCQGHVKDAILIGSDVWVGGHAIILRGASIPDHCIIGAGAVVDRKLRLRPYDIVRGNPGKVVGNRMEQHTADELQHKRGRVRDCMPGTHNA